MTQTDLFITYEAHGAKYLFSKDSAPEYIDMVKRAIERTHRAKCETEMKLF